jgi:hypothetical protein
MERLTYWPNHTPRFYFTLSSELLHKPFESWPTYVSRDTSVGSVFADDAGGRGSVHNEAISFTTTSTTALEVVKFHLFFYLCIYFLSSFTHFRKREE